MAGTISFFNRLLPFATPGTPLWQDIIHLTAICGALYFAPQIQDWYRSKQIATGAPRPEDSGEQVEAIQAHEEPQVHNHIEQEEQPQEQQDAQQPAAVDEIPEVDDRPLEDAAGAAQPGPANIRDAPAPRNVGTKKAKALARKDQRRAYHEFQRSQGEAQRARDAEGAAEREAALAAERERRRAAEAKLEEKKAREREAKREAERKEREEDARRRERVVRLVREGLEESRMVDLWKVAKQVAGDVDEEWVEKILKGSGMVARKGDVTTMITGMGWCVRVTAEDMAKAYQTAHEKAEENGDGKVGLEEVGEVLQELLAKG